MAQIYVTDCGRVFQSVSLARAHVCGVACDDAVNGSGSGTSVCTNTSKFDLFDDTYPRVWTAPVGTTTRGHPLATAQILPAPQKTAGSAAAALDIVGKQCGIDLTGMSRRR